MPIKLKYPKLAQQPGGNFAQGFASSFVPSYTSAFAEANRNRTRQQEEERARGFAREQTRASQDFSTGQAEAGRRFVREQTQDDRGYGEKQTQEARAYAAAQAPIQEAAKLRMMEQEGKIERRNIGARAYAEPAGKFAAIRKERRMKPEDPMPDELLGGSKRATRPTADQLTIEGARALLKMAQDPNTAFLLTEEQKALAGELMARPGQGAALQGGPEVGGDPKEALRQRVLQHAQAKGIKPSQAAQELGIDPASLD